MWTFFLTTLSLNLKKKNLTSINLMHSFEQILDRRKLLSDALDLSFYVHLFIDSLIVPVHIWLSSVWCSASKLIQLNILMIIYLLSVLPSHCWFIKTTFTLGVWICSGKNGKQILTKRTEEDLQSKYSTKLSIFKVFGCFSQYQSVSSKWSLK